MVVYETIQVDMYVAERCREGKNVWELHIRNAGVDGSAAHILCRWDEEPSDADVARAKHIVERSLRFVTVTLSGQRKKIEIPAPKCRIVLDGAQ